MSKVEEKKVVLPTLDELMSGELNDAQKQFVSVIVAYKKKNPLKFIVKEKEFIIKLLKLA
jgi:hypothetical protein